MRFEVEIEDFDIIASGTIIGVVDKPIIFKIEDLIFEFIFKDNLKEQRLFTQIPPDGKKMIMQFENFNNSLGTGNLEPTKIGFLNDKDLFINYRVYALAEKASKLLHYTWLLGKNKGGVNG